MSYRGEAARHYWGARRAVARRVRPGRDDLFWNGYADMAGALAAFLTANAVELSGARVASVKCGDGAVALGLVHFVEPVQLVAFESVKADGAALLERAREARVATELPAELHFEGLVPEGIPAAEATFDAVLVAAAWSDFAALTHLIRDIPRVLRPGGLVALILSRDWPPRLAPHAAQAADSRPTLEEIQGTVLAAGLSVDSLSLEAPLTKIPQPHSWLPFTQLAVREVALLARATRPANMVAG